MKEGREKAFARLAAGGQQRDAWLSLGTSSVSPCSVPNTTQRLLLMGDGTLEPSRPPKPLLDESAGADWLRAPGRTRLRVCTLARLLLCTFPASPSNTAGGGAGRGEGGSTSSTGSAEPSRNVDPRHGGRMKASPGSWFWHKADHSGDSRGGTAPAWAPAWLTPHGQP